MSVDFSNRATGGSLIKIYLQCIARRIGGPRPSEKVITGRECDVSNLHWHLRQKVM